MISIKDFDKEKEENLCVLVTEFNKIYTIYPKEITGYTYYELWEKSGKHQELLDWRNFYNDPRVRKWYEIELTLALDSKIHKLLQTAGTDKSTATQQTLTALLRHKEDSSMDVEESKYFIYTHWPLTNVEEHIPNVKISEAIPKEISSAISIFERTK